MSISTPPDAVTISDWAAGVRAFTGSSWRVPVAGDQYIVARNSPDIPVEIRGVKHADGRVDRWVAVGDVPEDLPLATARMLAESLAAAAAEAERQ